MTIPWQFFSGVLCVKAVRSNQCSANQFRKIEQLAWKLTFIQQCIFRQSNPWRTFWQFQHQGCEAMHRPLWIETDCHHCHALKKNQFKQHDNLQSVCHLSHVHQSNEMFLTVCTFFVCHDPSDHVSPNQQSCPFFQFPVHCQMSRTSRLFVVEMLCWSWSWQTKKGFQAIMFTSCGWTSELCVLDVDVMSWVMMSLSAAVSFKWVTTKKNVSNNIRSLCAPQMQSFDHLVHNCLNAWLDNLRMNVLHLSQTSAVWNHDHKGVIACAAQSAIRTRHPKVCSTRACQKSTASAQRTRGEVTNMSGLHVAPFDSGKRQCDMEPNKRQNIVLPLQEMPSQCVHSMRWGVPQSWRQCLFQERIEVNSVATDDGLNAIAACHQHCHLHDDVKDCSTRHKLWMSVR